MNRSSILIAGALVLALGAWLASGMLGSADRPAEAPQEVRTPEPPLVEVVRSEAAPVSLHIVAQGDVQAFRSAAARAETAGRVESLAVDIGERLEAGEVVATLSEEGRASRLRAARSVLEQRRADYEATESLLDEGFVTESRVRELRTELESAREEVRRLETEVRNTIVTAPFAGVVNAIAVEAGEYVGVNAEIATLIDNSPLRVDVRVNQQDVSRVPLGAAARVAFATGETEVGRVCFVSAAAEPRTRTFRVEVRTPNAGNALPSGISAEVRVPTGETAAHLVSPAILALGPDGALGLKTVDEDGGVAFHPVDVVRAETDGVWVSGLPDLARIITVGQGFVQAGDRVRVAEADAPRLGPAGRALADVEPPGQAICEQAGGTDGQAEQGPLVTGATEPAEDDR